MFHSLAPGLIRSLVKTPMTHLYRSISLLLNIGASKGDIYVCSLFGQTSLLLGLQPIPVAHLLGEVRVPTSHQQLGELHRFLQAKHDVISKYVMQQYTLFF